MIGVLLVNLGSPTSADPKDVYSYLTQFLLDPAVIDLPYPIRQILVRAIIIPLRYKKSARAYEEIWTKEGSPLIYHSKKLAQSVQESLGKDFHVALGMRYGTPSIADAMQELSKHALSQTIVLPLFPQYATATTGSILKSISLTNATSITHFYDNPFFIEAWVEAAQGYNFADYDHTIFSFHGLPVRHLRKNKNGLCYKSHCYETSKLITTRLNLAPEKYSISFQSRLGLDKWLEPFTIEVIKNRAKMGDKKLLIFSPSFVADCLETLYELGIEAKEAFIQHGGKTLDVVPSLNSSPRWVEAVCSLVQNSVAKYSSKF
jgi:protoporphyrin/coproporphyrin ferrochelatase